MNFSMVKRGSSFVLVTGVPMSVLQSYEYEYRMLSFFEKEGDNFIIPRYKLYDVLEICFDHFSSDALMEIAGLVEKYDKDLRDKIVEKSASKRNRGSDHSRDRKDQERRDQERKDQERRDQERREQERKEQERRDQERKEQERRDQERKEQERKEQERKEQDRKSKENSDPVRAWMITIRNLRKDLDQIESLMQHESVKKLL